jgi:subtilase family serine protease
VFSSSAILLGTHAVPPLAAGGSNTASTTVLLPANLATGSYYVLVAADVNNQVAEPLENNNVASGALVRVGADLTISALTVPTPVIAGANVTLNDTVRNQGGGAASPSTTRFYLSTNSTLNASDVLVGSRSVGALDPNQTSAGAIEITIPAGTAAGLYYVIAAADSDGLVPETTETNNTRVVLFRVNAGS